MIYAGDKPQRRILFLAREAAKWFVPIRVKILARRQLWRPMILRWRRARRRPDATTFRRSISSAKFLASPQVHFHFATCVIDRLQRAPRMFVAVPTPGTRVVIERTTIGSRAATLSSQPNLHDRNLSAAPTPVDPKIIINWKSIIRNTTRFHSSPAFAPAIVYRQNHLFPGQGSRDRGRSLQKQQLTQSPLTHARVFETLLRTFSLRTQTIGYSVHPRQQQRTVSQLQFHAPEELLWRRVPPRQLELDEHSQSVEGLANSVQRQSIHSIPIHETTVAVARANEKVPAQQITRLDPALVDRLADDVIRRMEQRVRIERQRRGL